MDDFAAAIEAVTENLSAFGGNGYRAANSSAAVAALCRDVGLEEGEAKRLGRQAVAHLGGYVEQVVHTGGIAAGRRRRHHREVWWVPSSALS